MVTSPRFNFLGDLLAPIHADRSTAKATFIIAALEDNDDGDDTTTGICGWVLSSEVTDYCTS